ncbi:hypothetical protein MNBD_GAMMA16-1301 [hydrothermal vent metagenome]|uniref:Transglycosylase SLT domain-containing protein n=1 Tax=hydrothermal vent metagenome TaxID=652676 RepID=A0A3B0ZT32_9ZZZZ
MMLSACAQMPPKDVDNICSIFEEKSDWYSSAKKSSERWGAPIHVTMAIIQQESHFYAYAKPPRKKFLGLIPTFRPTSAYGYAQAIDGTWQQYQKATNNSWADRDSFEDAIDFVGWYIRRSHSLLKISKWDAYLQYLAYHEGQTGFKNKSYMKKPWLINVAKKVRKQSRRYINQLKKCEPHLQRKTSGWFF